MLQLEMKLKRLQLRKKLLPMILILSILLPLILIPSIRSNAESYNIGDITYTYHDQSFQFHFIGASPNSNYSIHDSVLEYVIEKTAEAHNISIASGIGATISGLVSTLAVSIYNFVRNYLTIFGFGSADNWFDKSSIYGWEYNFTSFDDNYPGHETYGTAYGFRFTGILGEKIDLVLQADGTLYGSSPIGNLTFSQGQQDLSDWSDTQIENDDLLSPVVPSQSFNNLPTPYIMGKSLYFTVLINNVQHNYVLDDFRNINIGLMGNNAGMVTFVFYSALGNDLSTSNYHLTDNGSPVQLWSAQFNFTDWRGLNPTKTSCIALFPDNLRSFSFNLPGYYTLQTTFGKNNVKGFYQEQPVSGFSDIFLYSLDTSPLPNPIVLPVDDPIPVNDVPGDPVDFDPGPEDDPEPVPGIDYPDPGPLPFPVPDIPPIVSGNDDLWPDLNLTFDIEDSLLDLTSSLGNFDWPEFSGLVGNFVNALIWVSTIMTTLYEGTGFSVLFNVLAVFFIAAALFGLYKWWNK